ncbi:hypothetical protein AYI70_g5250 [Smittium culicis]|uniref:Uncharacterized protein n=1 Tax=Smittium culicis TaxID=133412 RepID=A0A1R1XVJ1_9FUNG|nr:hypothetical protein AYI70_g5250 [Smittium culicis]
MDYDLIFKKTVFSVKIPSPDYSPSQNVASLLSHDSRKHIAIGENVDAYLLAIIPRKALSDAMLPSFANSLNSHGSNNLEFNTKQSFIDFYADSSFQVLENEAFKYLLAFKFSVTTYLSIIVNKNSSQQNPISLSSSNSLSDSKVSISVQSVSPSHPNSSDASQNPPLIFGYNESTLEWIGAYKFKLDSKNNLNNNDVVLLNSHSASGLGLSIAQDNFDLEIRVSNQILDDFYLNSQDASIIDPKNINPQFVSLNSISKWITNKHNISNFNPQSSIQFGQSNLPLFNDKGHIPSLLSRPSNQLSILPGAEGSDLDALLNFPRRMFRTTVKTNPIIKLGYRLVQSPPFCGLDTVYLEVTISNSYSLPQKHPENTSIPSSDSDFGPVELVSLELDHKNLVISRLSDFNPLLFSKKKIISITNHSNTSTQNCFSSPKIFKPNESWSEIFSISASSFKSCYKNQDSSNISQNLNSNVNSELASSLSIVARGYIVELDNNSHKSSTRLSSLLEHKINVDINSLLLSSNISPHEKNKLSYNSITNRSICESTPSFLQLNGGFNLSSNSQNVISNKNLPEYNSKNNALSFGSLIGKSLPVGLDNSTNSPAVIYSPLLAQRPHIPFKGGFPLSQSEYESNNSDVFNNGIGQASSGLYYNGFDKHSSNNKSLTIKSLLYNISERKSSIAGANYSSASNANDRDSLDKPLPNPERSYANTKSDKISLGKKQNTLFSPLPSSPQTSFSSLEPTNRARSTTSPMLHNSKFNNPIKDNKSYKSRYSTADSFHFSGDHSSNDYDHSRLPKTLPITNVPSPVFPTSLPPNKRLSLENFTFSKYSNISKGYTYSPDYSNIHSKQKIHGEDYFKINSRSSSISKQTINQYLTQDNNAMPSNLVFSNRNSLSKINKNMSNSSVSLKYGMVLSKNANGLVGNTTRNFDIDADENIAKSTFSLSEFGLCVSIKAQPKAKAGNVVPVIITITNVGSSEISGLSITSELINTLEDNTRTADQTAFSTNYTTQKNELSELISDINSQSLVEHSLFSLNLLAIDHKADIGTIGPQSSAKVVIRYYAPTSDFSGIGSLYLYAHADNFSSLYTSETAAAAAATAEHNAPSNSEKPNIDYANETHNGLTIRPALIAEFEAPIVVLVN